MVIYYAPTGENLKADLVSSLVEKDILSGDELRRLNRYYWHPIGFRRCSNCCEVKDV